MARSIEIHVSFLGRFFFLVGRVKLEMVTCEVPEQVAGKGKLELLPFLAWLEYFDFLGNPGESSSPFADVFCDVARNLTASDLCQDGVGCGFDRAFGGAYFPHPEVCHSCEVCVQKILRVVHHDHC